MKLWMMLGPAMLFSSDVWAVYGIGLDMRDNGVVDGCVDCSATTGSEISPPPGHKSSNVATTPLPPSTYSQKITPPTTHDTFTSPAPPSVSAPPHLSTSFVNLSTSTKAGLISGFALLILSLSLLLLEFGFLRRKRRERALRRAVEEVERDAGVELKAIVESRSESKENMVLESCVEIIVVQEERESEGVVGGRASEEGDGWEADGEDEEKRRRRRESGHAMSLPRRESR